VFILVFGRFCYNQGKQSVFPIIDFSEISRIVKILDIIEIAQTLKIIDFIKILEIVKIIVAVKSEMCFDDCWKNL
jgi:hypothetical protein